MNETPELNLLPRLLSKRLQQRLSEVPAVALLGPRQVGKTTLALATADQTDALYLDLQSEKDRALLSEPEHFLSTNSNRLVILDEIHRVPSLFPVLRGLIDKGRRAGRKASQFLILGSASIDLLKQSGESLAGRISYLELGPLCLSEVNDLDRLWLRGGFPDSYLAQSDEASMRWRTDFIRTYVEREALQFSARLTSETLRRLWALTALNQGGLLNVAQLGRNVGIDVQTTARYLDLLEGLMLIRRLTPWHSNVGKRLIKSPKMYVRDSGVLHALLQIDNQRSLLSHPQIGLSWEGFVIDNVISVLPENCKAHFYRTSGGAEIDLVLHWTNGNAWAIEIKRSIKPAASRGFHEACEDIQASKRFIVYSGDNEFRLANGVTAISVLKLMELLAS